MTYEPIKVAIVGRPNVGKSTLFNRLLKERKSIIDDTPGVTRDRLYADVEWNGKLITFIDTGGLVEEGEIKDDKEIILGVRQQVFKAIDESEFVVFLVDGTAGITPEDKKIADRLRKFKNNKKIFLAVNKIDTEKQLDLVYEFYSLGFGEPYGISALSGSEGLADLLDEVVKGSKAVPEKIDENLIKLAISGKPNVGKSSILNCLVDQERSIVSDIPGTTRDSIDTKVKVAGRNYLIIDTAGLRRKAKVSSKIERYATLRAIESIERADVVLFVVEANTKISDQDQKVAALIKKSNKPSVIIVNKWDLIPSGTSEIMKKIEGEILFSLHFINYSEVLFISALHKKNTSKIFDLVDKAYKNCTSRISTGKLNRIIEEIILQTSPPSKKGKSLRIYYATQANVNPPEIVLFVNDSELVSEAYTRFLEKEIRKNFDFTGTPIKLEFRNKKK